MSWRREPLLSSTRICWRDKREVGGFDWSVVKPRLDAFVSSAHATATPRKARSADDAKVLRYKHYDQHRAIYDAMSDDDRQEVLNLLMAGVPDARDLPQISP